MKRFQEHPYVLRFTFYVHDLPICEFLKVGGGEGKDGVRRAGGRPELNELQQILVDDGLQGFLVPNGRDAPDSAIFLCLNVRVL